MDELKNMKIVVTRPRDQADEFVMRLHQRGAVVVRFPVIRIEPLEDTSELDQALRNLNTYDWLIVTSVNGVEAVWDRFSALGIPPTFDNVRIAAIGPKTAAALEHQSVTPTFVPQEYVAEAILPGLGELTGRKFLLARADLARPALAVALREAGGEVDDLDCYRTVSEEPHRQTFIELQSGADIVTFTSPSTVDNFVRLLREEGLEPTALPGDPIIACIGPITAARAEKFGFHVDIVPDSYTTEGLIDAMATFQHSLKVDVA